MKKQATLALLIALLSLEQISFLPNRSLCIDNIKSVCTCVILRSHHLCRSQRSKRVISCFINRHKIDKKSAAEYTLRTWMAEQQFCAGIVDPAKDHVSVSPVARFQLRGLRGIVITPVWARHKIRS